MNLHLKKFISTADQEQLHKFRVQIKKLQAMLILFGAALGDEGLLKYFKPVKKIFKQGGIIRDAYIHLQFAREYNFENENFELSQNQVIDAGIKSFKKRKKDFIKTISSTHGAVLKNLKKVPNKAIKLFYLKQLQEIAARLEKPEFTEEMHDTRKRLKVLMYNKKLTDNALDGVVLNVSYIDELQDCIGKWHDNVLARTLFSAPELDAGAVVARIDDKDATLQQSVLTLAENFLERATARPAV